MTTRRTAVISLGIAIPILLLGLVGSLVAMPRTRIMAAPAAPGRAIFLATAGGVRLEANY